jgi:hypothetical protein
MARSPEPLPPRTTLADPTTTNLSFTANGESPSSGTYWQQVDADLVVFGSLSTHDFQWLLEGNPIPGATGLTYTPLVSGNYALEATMLGFPCPPYITDSQYIEVLVTGVDENGTSRFFTSTQTLPLLSSPWMASPQAAPSP